MADGYVLSRELKQAVQDIVRQYSNSFQPRPLKGRRQRQFIPQPSEQETEANNFRAITTTVGSAATGIVNGNQTPGTGFAKLYVQPADGTIGGTAWTPGEVVLYENWMHAPIAINKPILLRKSRDNVTTGGILYEIVAEGCGVVPTQ
jgi:hypothetical protein